MNFIKKKKPNIAIYTERKEQKKLRSSEMKGKRKNVQINIRHYFFPLNLLKIQTSVQSTITLSCGTEVHGVEIHTTTLTQRRGQNYGHTVIRSLSVSYVTWYNAKSTQTQKLRIYCVTPKAITKNK